jgi:hypothetical protein
MDLVRIAITSRDFPENLIGKGLDSMILYAKEKDDWKDLVRLAREESCYSDRLRKVAVEALKDNGELYRLNPEVSSTHNKELAGEELVKFFINFYHVLDSANHLYKEEYRYAHYSISNIAIPFMFNKGIQHVTHLNPYIGTAIYAISLMPKYQKQDLLCPIIGNLSEEWCSDWNTQEKTFAIRAFDTSAAIVLSAAISFGMHIAGQVLARIPRIDEYGQTLEKANLAIGFVASVLSIATEASYYLYQEVETQTNDNVPLLVGGDTSSHDEI